MKENEEQAEKISVFIRVRPLFHQEPNFAHTIVINQNENLILLKKNEVTSRQFIFDHVFEEDATQMFLYQRVAFPITESVLEGYNGTIFAFGQTGTGKTYTMIGDHKIDHLKGIIPNTFLHIFNNISLADNETFFVVIVSYLEIYNEEVRDLLSENPLAKLNIKERPDVGVYIKDLTRFTVDSVKSITSLLIQGNTNRSTRFTTMNSESSRSHTIFTITVETTTKKRTSIGKLNLVDLAGSERASKTQATGECLREACNINVSLSVLGSVISALVDSNNSYIPYRNSKLTRLLKDSLGGNSKTAMIATISKADADYEETFCTLRYATRVKQIKNYLKLNVEPKSLIQNFENEISKLQQQLNALIKPKTKVISKDTRKVADELTKIEQEKTELLNKISIVQRKILVGGENLLEKAQLQTLQLKSSNDEIRNLDESTHQLEEVLSNKTLEKIDIEERYTSLQEEDAGLSKKLEKVQRMLNKIKKEQTEQEHEYHKEMEELLDTNRLLDRQTKLTELILDTTIPKDYLQKIESNVIWNTDIQDYQLCGVAYVGNHIKEKKLCQPHKSSQKSIYRRYSSEARNVKICKRCTTSRV